MCKTHEKKATKYEKYVSRETERRNKAIETCSAVYTA